MALSQESRSIIELPTPIERADRLPAGRVALLAFVADRQTKTDVEESLAPLALADSPVMRGGIVKAIQFLASERSPGPCARYATRRGCGWRSARAICSTAMSSSSTATARAGATP